MDFGVRILSLRATLACAFILSLAIPISDAVAQKTETARARSVARGSTPSQRAVSGRTAPRTSARGLVSRSSRAFVPRTRRLARSPSKRITTLRKQVITPRVKRQTKRTVPRIVTPRASDGVTRRQVPVSSLRTTRRSVRKVPTNLALLNSGLRRYPGRSKPAHIQHDAKRKAGKSGWMHRHRPFVFKHGGHRWRRHYYSFLVGGLWYWYWYDIVADTDPDVIIYSDAVLPDCDPESDECIEPGALIAPAILEGRATEEDMARCAARFRSFDRATGTYVTYGGQVRICPYLE